jgi:lambda family phage tail tape measure protein
MDLIHLFFKADTKELDEAKEKLHGLGSEMPNIGQAIEGMLGKLKAVPGAVGLAVAAFVGLGLAMKGMIEHTLEAEERLLDLSEAMGIPIEKAQPFIAAMELAGVSAEKLQNTLGKFSQNIESAISQPAGKAAAAFRQLGISQEELAKGDTEALIKKTAAAFDDYAESAQKTAAMRELLGKSGPQIVNELQEEEELERKVAEAQRDYGTAISESDAKAAKYFGETLKLGKSMFEGVGVSITRSMLPGLQELVNQFAESGKQGGFLRNILDGLSATLSVVAKAIMTLLVEPVRVVVTIFKEAGTIIGGTLAAINAAAHGNFSEAGDIIKQTGSDMKQIAVDAADDMVKFEKALWATGEAAKDTSAKVDEGGKKWDGYNAAAQAVSDTLDDLNAKLKAQHEIEAAAGEGLAAYKEVQEEAAIATMKLKLAREGATAAQIADAEATARALALSKQITADELAGWSLINKLKAENIGLTTEQVQLQKELEEIAKHPMMTDAQKEEATELAKKNAQLRQEARLKAEIAEMSAIVDRANDKEIASLRMGTNQLRLYNNEQRLREQAAKQIAKDPANADGITRELDKQIKKLRDADAELQKYKTSWDGCFGGATKAMQDFAAEATDLNKIGQDLTTTFLDGFANALVSMGESGKSAWKEMGLAIAKYIEMVVAKFVVLEGAILIMKALGVSAATIDAILGAGASSMFGGMLGGSKKNADGNVFSGGGIQQFANGGVVGQRSFFDIGEMAEQGPEAIMPLQRDSQGRLGVHVAGGSSSSGGGVTHYHAPQITINTNQNPDEIAKQVKRTTEMHDAMTTRKLAKEQRSGGMLRGASYAFR